ncbi:unnamed protein product [marine sediment metagenome]|uniref:Uncharacterized protein n=1 Tax=marine sediment metagenome TaxID=412755 RepID=X1S3Z7_9ZZZZ
MSPILDYTTKVPVSRTISQIQAKLVEHGARAVMMEYGDDGRIKALAFNVKMPNGELPIRLQRRMLFSVLPVRIRSRVAQVVSSAM